MNKINLLCKIIAMFLGVLFIGIGIAFLRKSGFGVDPFTCMNLGISKKMGISLGVFQLILNLFLFGIMILYGNRYIGIGMIANMVLVGFISDFFTKLFIYNENIFLIKIIYMLIGCTVICLGVSIYSSANMGLAPYDAFGWVIEDLTNHKISFKLTRVVTDVICIGIGILYGSVIGINTIIMAFFTGPLVEFFTQRLINTKFNIAKKIYNLK